MLSHTKPAINSGHKQRFVTVAATTLAMALSPICLIWYCVRNIADYDEMYPFLGISILNLIAIVTLLITGRSRGRWLILVFALPCAFILVEKAFNLMMWLRM